MPDNSLTSSESLPHAILRKYWGYEAFRGVQAEIIGSILSGKDTLGLMPTGGGKSLTFQVPALCMEGLCLVITPLVALMRDQVQQLRRHNILAVDINGSMSSAEIERTLDNCIFGRNKLLYISPERLDSPLFQKRIQRMNVSFIAVDEAHCISQWGYDFRPSYLHIKEIRSILPHAPILALTATATPDTVTDICRQLGFRQGENVFRMSFERKNLHYEARFTENKPQQILQILDSTPGSAVIYTRSRESTVDIAQMLTEAGISAQHYHAGLPVTDRNLRQARWQTGEKRVMVATNAFGMGIDKPDVRLVMHIDPPSSLEAYFQEAGRAGRDGQEAWAILLHNRHDITRLQRHLTQEFPPKDFCRQIYDELAYFFQLPMGEGQDTTKEFNIGLFCRNFHHYPASVESALRILTQTGCITYREAEDSRSRLMFLVGRESLYHLRQLNAACDRVINALMRLYAGVFTEYVFIEESSVAELANAGEDDVYNILIELTRQRILSYIPHKSVPRIHYDQRRQESCHIRITPAIYEERKAIMERRLQAMTDYFSLPDTKRSLYLRRYFGDV